MNPELVHAFDRDFPINHNHSKPYLSCQPTAHEGYGG